MTNDGTIFKGVKTSPGYVEYARRRNTIVNDMETRQAGLQNVDDLATFDQKELITDYEKRHYHARSQTRRHFCFQFYVFPSFLASFGRREGTTLG